MPHHHSTRLAHVLLSLILFFSLSSPSRPAALAEPPGGAELPVPAMLKDINTTPYPSTPGGLYPLDGLVYFAADGGAGREVWRSDGTLDGTFQVSDIYPGPGGSVEGQLHDADFFGSLNGTLFFPADDGSGAGIELWKTDGTPAGTLLVKDIYPGGDSRPDGFVSAGGLLFFVADDGGGRTLWRSDGTLGGTFSSGVLATAYARNTTMAAYGDRIYFRGCDPARGCELWRWNGLPGQAEIVAEINPTGDANPDHLAVVGDSLYFAADDGAYGVELWKASPAGVELVRDIVEGSGSSSPANLAALNGQVFFAATTPAQGTELWHSDGSADGTALVADLNPGEASGLNAYEPMLAMGGVLYFLGGDSLTGFELWKTDGTAVSLVKDINPGAYGSGISAITALDGVLYFSAKNLPASYISLSNYELWRSDGTPVGTYQVKDIRPGEGSAFNANPIVVSGGKLFFGAADRPSGWDLWVSDGSAAGTTRLPVNPMTAGAAIGLVIPLGERLFFGADDGLHGLEPWISDGTPSGTRMIKDLVPGEGDGIYTGGLVAAGSLVVGQELYFSGYALDEAQNLTTMLWVTDGSPAGTRMVTRILPKTMAAVGKTVFFLYGYDDDVRLFKTDGTPQGTVELKHWGTGYDLDYYSRGLDGRYYFFLRNGITPELWESDGTPVGTRLATITSRVDLLILKGGVEMPDGLILYVDGGQIWQSTGDPGSAQVIPGDYLYYAGSVPVAADGWLYFIATNAAGTSTYNLYHTRGLSSGIELVMENVHWIQAAFGEQVYFTYFRQVNGTWLKNLGRAGGDPLVVERLEPAVGTYSHEPSPDTTRIAQVGRQAYFYGTDATYGAELWTSDGTPAGTRVIDLNPGPASSGADDLFFVHGRLFLSADNGINGQELWVVDTLTRRTYLPAIRR